MSAKKWANRIVGYGEEYPEKLAPHGSNYRLHGSYQRALVEEALEIIGWIQDVVVNKTTGNVLDGHLRRDLAILHNEALALEGEKAEKIPVKYVKIPAEQEELVLTVFDPSSALAGTNTAKLAEILDRLRVATPAIEQLRTDMRSKIDRTRQALEERKDALREAASSVKAVDNSGEIALGFTVEDAAVVRDAIARYGMEYVSSRVAAYLSRSMAADGLT